MKKTAHGQTSPSAANGQKTQIQKERTAAYRSTSGNSENCHGKAQKPHPDVSGAKHSAKPQNGQNLRRIAYRLLCRWEAGDSYANLVLSTHELDTLSRQEKARVTALFYTAVEHKITYDYLIGALSARSPESLDPSVRNLLRLGLAQILDLSKIPVPVAVNETVALAQNPGERSFVNALLRRAAREKDKLPFPDRKKNAARYLSVRWSFPLPTVRTFLALYGEENTEKLLSTFNEKSPLTLTVNTAKISRDDFMKMLEEADIAAEKTEHSPYGVRLSADAPAPTALPGFAEGDFFVQDEASQLAVLALDPKPGDFVIDTCAAPGGKAFLSAVLTGRDVRAFDLHETKLSLISDGAARLGLPVSVAARDATDPDPTLAGKADAVLCDVPCSGLGVLGKKPDLRYKDITALETLPPLQKTILAASASYVRPGGTLVYSTCTLNPAENGDVVRDFLAAHPDFSAADFSLGGFESRDGMLSTLPYCDRMDGFFIAKMKKRP